MKVEFVAGGDRSHAAWTEFMPVRVADRRHHQERRALTLIYTKKEEPRFVNQSSSRKKVAMTYSPTNLCSTIGAVGLNFSVRDGKRWNPNAINRLNKGPIFHIVTQIKVNLLLKQTIHILITYETSIAWMYRSMLMAQARTFSLARKKSFRAISTARLNMLPCLHLQPINVVVYDDPYEEI